MLGSVSSGESLMCFCNWPQLLLQHQVLPSGLSSWRSRQILWRLSQHRISMMWATVLHPRRQRVPPCQMLADQGTRIEGQRRETGQGGTPGMETGGLGTTRGSAAAAGGIGGTAAEVGTDKGPAGQLDKVHAGIYLRACTGCSPTEACACSHSMHFGCRPGSQAWCWSPPLTCCCRSRTRSRDRDFGVSSRDKERDRRSRRSSRSKSRDKYR